MPEASECPKCGGPQAAGHVLCTFCKSPYSEEALRTAIKCRTCPTLTAWGQMKCIGCSSWIVVQCVFCGNLSPHVVSSCLTCNEAFQGAPERKAAREAEISRQRTQSAVSTYGGVGASFLGSLAGSFIGAEMGSSSTSSSSSSDDSSIVGSLFDSATSGSWFDSD